MEGYTNLADDAFIRTDIEIMTAFNVVQMKTILPKKMFYAAEGPIIESAGHTLREHSFAKSMHVDW